MKMLIANLMALGVLGAATAVSAQTDNPRDQGGDHARPAATDRARPGQAAPTGAEQRARASDLLQRRANGIDRRQDVRAQQGDANRARAAVIDRRQWQRNVQATRRFRAGFYRAPPGFAYRRWTYGQRLPGIYFGQNYWLTNWAIYGLFAPSDGLVWVRYGPDAMLVDRYSGEIVQVRYGVFY